VSPVCLCLCLCFCFFLSFFFFFLLHLRRPVLSLHVSCRSEQRQRHLSQRGPELALPTRSLLCLLPHHGTTSTNIIRILHHHPVHLPHRPPVHSPSPHLLPYPPSRQARHGCQPVQLARRRAARRRQGQEGRKGNHHLQTPSSSPQIMQGRLLTSYPSAEG
jgi:hypothetical protein